MAPLLYTQVHCLREGQEPCGGQLSAASALPDGWEILLMRRNKEPNLGQWVAPGGKIEAHESPYESAVRELREETGLFAHEVQLRGIVSVVMPALTAPHIQFLFVVTRFSGTLVADVREGTLRWWALDEALRLPMPSLNAGFLPRILDGSGTLYQAKYVYDGAWRLVEVVEHTGTVDG